MPNITSAPHLEKARELRSLLAAYAKSEDLIRIGAYQLPAEVEGDTPAARKACHVERLLAAIEGAGRAGVDLVCVGETSTTNHLHAPPGDQSLFEDALDGPTTRHVARLAAGYRMHVALAVAGFWQGARRNLAAMTAERDAYIQGWRAEVSQKLSEATRKLSDAREQSNKAKLRRELVELRADADATVQSVAKVSVGSVMQSGQHFITLVPADAPLEIEANIIGRDNGFVHVGDPVAIKFDTFPYSQYGMAEGTVRVVSPDSFTAQDEARNPTSAVPLPPASTEPFYRARIAIDKAALHDVPGGFRVVPGMPVTADVKVGKRTVLSYLLGRIMPVATEGMREP